LFTHQAKQTRVYPLTGAEDCFAVCILTLAEVQDGPAYEDEEPINIDELDDTERRLYSAMNALIEPEPIAKKHLRREQKRLSASEEERLARRQRAEHNSSSNRAQRQSDEKHRL
jgi:DNA polymerase II large subunit